MKAFLERNQMVSMIVAMAVASLVSAGFSRRAAASAPRSVTFSTLKTCPACSAPSSSSSPALY